MQVPIYTIGHGSRSLEEFVSLLQNYQIQYLIDVRSQPYSRYVPHFSKAEPISEIPSGTLLRVSLARWWKKYEEEEKKCYLQLSGWYS